MTRRQRNRLLVSLAIALAVSVILAVELQFGPLPSFQTRSTDLRLQFRRPGVARSTVIVGLDERSYLALQPQYGSFADWSRVVWIRTLDALAQASPRLVVFDIVFDSTKPDDSELAATMTRMANVLLPEIAQAPVAIGSNSASDSTPEFETLLEPPADLVQSALDVGLVNITTDQDVVVRSVPLVREVDGNSVPSLALAAAARYARRPRVIDAAPDADYVYAAGRAIPTISGARLLINFLGPASSISEGGSVTIIPLADVLNGTYDRGLVRDRITLVALTMQGADQYITPATSGIRRMWGAEILANTIETILDQRYVLPPPPVVTAGLMLLLALAAAILVALSSPAIATIAVLVLLVVYLLVTLVALDPRVFLNVVYPPAALLFTFGLTLAYQLLSHRSEQRFLRDVTSHYLSPSVSEWVLEHRNRLRLGGETRTMTVLFADVRGFTTLSHALDAEPLVKVLNEFMTAMTEVIFKHDGVLDKYIGDAIMAFWNAPMPQPDHARLACESALEMVQRLQTLQAEWARAGQIPLEIGIGINTGPMVVGNMGAHDHLAYTVLGDAVNVASRLEGLTKLYHTRIVIGEATREAAADGFAFRSLDVVAVKGRNEPLEVFELLGKADQLESIHIATAQRYQSAIELYRARKWPQAQNVFCELQLAAPSDGPVGLYVQRINELLAHPPPADWQPVFVADTK